MKKVVWSGVVLMTCLATAGTAIAAGGVQTPRPKVAQRLDARFKTMDGNHDGAISRDEWNGRPRVFDRLDANHDNALNPREVHRGVRRAAARRAIARHRHA